MAAGQERIHREQQLGLAPEERRCRSARSILWPLTATKSVPSACTSMRLCGAACAASVTWIAPRSCAQAAIRGMSFEPPSTFETYDGRDDLHVRVAGELVELVEMQRPVGVDREHPEVGALLVRDVLPRHEVRVVLELGDEHDVAGAEVGEAPRVRDQVDRLGRVADEDDLARATAR